MPNSRLAVDLEIPAEQSQASYEEALSRLSRSVKVPGFRKGKVPKAVILQQIGIDQIKATALEALIDRSWRDAIKKEGIEPLCEPELKDGFDSLIKTFQPGEVLKLTLETDVSPSPKLTKTKGLQAEIELISFDPSKVDELIEQSRKQLATLIPIENRAAKIGDVAVLSFKGIYTDDDSEIDGGSAESMDVDLEEGKMIPGFVEGIVGLSIGEEKTIDCKFPKDYPQKDSQGRGAKFKVQLKDLKARELPKLDDDFAKQASDKDSLEELKKDLEKRLKEDLKRKKENNKHEALLKTLVEQLEVDIPKTLIDQEVRSLVEQTARQFADQGMDVKSMFTAELVKSLMESSRDEAKANVKQKLALSALAEEESIEIDEKIINEKYQELSKQFSDRNDINKDALKQAVKEDLLQEKLLQWLEENNTIIEKKAKKESKSNASKVKR